MTISFEEFKKKYLGISKGYPTDSLYKGECLSIVKLYIKECHGIDAPASGSNSAYGYWSNFPAPLDTIFEKVVSTPTNFPSYGDVPIWKPWNGNEFGHIDVCNDKTATKDRFAGVDQNWGGKEAHVQEHNYDNVVGWLHLKKPLVDEQVQPLQYQVSEAIYKYIALDNKFSEGDLREGMESFKRGDVKNLNKAITDLKTEYDKKIETLTNGYEGKIKGMITKEDCATKVDEAVSRALIVPNGKIDSMQIELDRLASIEEKYQQLSQKGIRLFSFGGKTLLISFVDENKDENLPKDTG